MSSRKRVNPLFVEALGPGAEDDGLGFGEFGHGVPLLVVRVCGQSGFPLGAISDSNFQNGGLNERAAVCGDGSCMAAA